MRIGWRSRFPFVDGSIEAVEFFLREVLWVGEGGFADGADEGEGGVEHQVCLFCLVNIAVGVGEREGSMVGESATDACYGKEEGYQCAEGALQTVAVSILGIGCAVEHQ